MNKAGLKVAVFSLLVFLLSAGVFYYYAYEANFKNNIFSEQFWTERIVVTSPDAAYDELIQLASNLSVSKQHELVHEFGAALYRQGDLELLLVCDERFLYGCFHEFIGNTIAEYGLKIIEEINTICGNVVGVRNTACHHGVGHGIQTYLGYAEENLISALRVCDNFSNSDPIGGCYGGVFMEYNLHTMLVEDEVRPLTEDVLYPCDQLEKKYQESCMFRQPQWWKQHLVGKDISKTKALQLGEMCSSAPSSDMISSCFQGMGNIIAVNVDFDMDKAVSLCDSSSSKVLYKKVCRLQAFLTKGFAEGVSVQDSLKVCETLPLEDKKTCEVQVNTIMFDLESPR